MNASARSDAYASAFDRVRRRASDPETRVIATLLDEEPERLDRFTVQAAGLHVDIAKQRIAAGDLDELLTLARAAQLERQRDAMLEGECVNRSEHRAALHTVLRAPAGAADPRHMSGAIDEVAATLARMKELAESLRGGRWRGASGTRITDLVHVGIGGSRLGPQLACEALGARAHPAVRVHFLSNVDPDAWDRMRAALDAASTMVVIASKSWRTDETARNAAALRAWLLDGGVAPERLHLHLVAVTANVEAARAFGVPDRAILPFRDWVGGRFSLWSAIGFPVMVAIGAERFSCMLAGAHAMDLHFASAPLERNAPVLLALVSAWNRLALANSSEIVVPYCDALRSLPAHLQQLQMESNGKAVDIDGHPVGVATIPAVWGGVGTDAQHSYFQALHQGTVAHPVDFVVTIPARADPFARDRALIANAIAQGATLALGTTARRSGRTGSTDGGDALEVHRDLAGNRPSTTILVGELTPESFGALIALYEHKTAALGWLWRINSFDQWGVERGKQLAGAVERALGGEPSAGGSLDRSSRDLLERAANLLGARPSPAARDD
ncbi:MAG: glucose-6-phosphate isomerase [Burkholderiaceae bacterium]|nr:glucose-6-phosphate isomerase [Burkholderiaceae bacterium]